MKVGRFYLKERITLSDMHLTESYILAATGAKSGREAAFYLRRIVRTLTYSRWVFRWEFKLIDKILIAAGFQGAKEELTEENAIINMTSWIAAQQGGMTPQMVAESMTASEITPFVKEMARAVLEKSLRLLRAHHDPKGYSEELQREFEALEKKGRKSLPPKAQSNQIMNTMRNAFKAK